MRILRIILLSFLGCISLFFLGIFILVKAFDVNKYLPQITQQVGKAINRQVNVGHANLNVAFLKGISLELKDISISDDRQYSQKKFLTLGSVYVGLDLMSLIQKRQIAVTDIIISSPQLSIVRLPNGSINAQTMVPVSSSPAHPNAIPTKVMALPAVLIKSISIKHAQLSYEDQNDRMPMHVLVPDFEIQINNFNLTGPFDFTASIDAWGDKGQQNVKISGRCALDMAKTEFLMSDIQIKSDLGQWDWGNVRNVTPVLQTVPVWPQSIKGNLSVDIPKLNASAKGLEGLTLQMAWTDGYIKFKELLSPIEQITLTAGSDLNDLSIKKFEAHIGSGLIDVQADVKGLLSQPNYTFELQSKSVKVQELLDQGKAPVVINGEITGQFSGSGESFDPPVMLSNIKGEGDFALNNGKIEKLNILKTVLDKLNFLPGSIIQNSVETALPSNIKDQLDTDTTVLDKAQTKIKVDHKVISLTDMQVDSKLFSITAQGTVDFDLNTDIDVKTYLAADLSQAMTRSARPLQGLLDQQNRIYIPGKISGKSLSLKYLPQIDYITKKVAVSEGTQQITQQLQKVFVKNPAIKNILNSVLGGQADSSSNLNDGASSTDQTTNSQTQGDSSKNLVNGLLNKLIH